MNWLGTLGDHALRRVRSACYLAAALWTVLRLAVHRRHWPATTRAVFARQLLFTGIEALRFVALAALVTGVSVVVQTQLWLTHYGQSGLLGSVLVMVVIRELGPLLVNFIVIGRSGAAITVELANMKVMGELTVLEAQGIDTLLYLAMPRVLALALSVFSLTIAFIVVSFVSGYACGILAGVGAGDPRLFLESVLKGLRPEDVHNVLAKTLIPGMATAIISVMEGVSVGHAVTEVPQAATRAVVRSTVALFVVSAVVSLLTYA